MKKYSNSLLYATSKSEIIECIKNVKKDLISYYKIIDKNFTKLSMNFERNQRTKRSFDCWFYDNHEGIDRYTINYVIDAMQTLETFNNEKLANLIMQWLNDFYIVTSKNKQLVDTNK